MNWKYGAAAAALLAMALPAGSALAHTNYMLPNVFSTANADAVTIETSFTEDFFRPEIGVESQDFHVVRPSGAREAYDNVAKLRQMTVLENDLTEAGTYRFSTGERLGRSNTQVRVDGEWRPLGAGETAPRGARTQTSQTATVAEVYVSKGAPTRAAVDAPAGRLAFRPVTHPSEIYLADGFEFLVQFDGRALRNQEITVERGGGAYDEPPFSQTMRSDAEGHVKVSFTQPGVYLVMTRHRANAPRGAETDVRSYTTTLTFEVSR